MPAGRLSIRALLGAVSLIAALGLWAAPRANALSLTMTGTMFPSDPVFLSLNVIPDLPPVPSPPGTATYTLGASGPLFPGGYFWVMTGAIFAAGSSGSVTVIDGPDYDLIRFDLQDGSKQLLVDFFDPTGTVLSDTSFPYQFPSFSSFVGGSGVLIENSFLTASFTVTGISGDVVVASVPAPAVSGLLALGAFGLAALRRRRPSRS